MINRFQHKTCSKCNGEGEVPDMSLQYVTHQTKGVLRIIGRDIKSLFWNRYKHEPTEATILIWLLLTIISVIGLIAKLIYYLVKSHFPNWLFIGSSVWVGLIIGFIGCMYLRRVIRESKEK